MTESTHIFQNVLKNYDYYLIKNDFKLVFSSYEDCPHLNCDYANNNIKFLGRMFWKK